MPNRSNARAISLKNPILNIVPTAISSKVSAKVNEEVPISPIDVDLYVIILNVAIRNTINATIKKHSEINKISIIITNLHNKHKFEN